MNGAEDGPLAPDDQSPTSRELAASAALRAAVAEAGHRGDSAPARAALADDDPAVRATALGALRRCGALTGDDLRAAIVDPSAIVRRRAAEEAAAAVGVHGAGEVPDGVSLLPLLDDHDATVQEVAAWACGELLPPEPGTVDRLAALAVDHGDALVREAAVAALGAIGDETGLAAVLTATADKATVRRRAVIALAAFEGPAVDAALQKALGDRDWQVRQAAEDLTRE